MRIGGRGQGQGKTRRNHVVENFLSSWLDKNIEGVRNNIWLEGNPNVKGEAKCKLWRTALGAQSGNHHLCWLRVWVQADLPGDIKKTSERKKKTLREIWSRKSLARK